MAWSSRWTTPVTSRCLGRLETDLGTAIHPVVAVRDDLVRLIGQMYGPGRGEEGDWAESRESDPKPAGDPRSKRVQLDDLLDRVLRLDGSDLHLTVGSPPVVRVQGELQRMEGMAPLNGSDVRRLVLGMLTQAQRERFLAEGELATSHAIPGKGRFRVSAFIQRDSVGAVLRLVPAGIPSPEDLGLPDEVIEWSDAKRGLVLVCGPHGSGTSTTLAALVDRINRARACHILTIEQPIEFLHQHRMAIVNQREVGEDTASFERGLRYALRQDPDVLVVGELPDVETIRHALTAAETGQLVLATLRTVDAMKTIERIVDDVPGRPAGPGAAPAGHHPSRHRRAAARARARRGRRPGGGGAAPDAGGAGVHPPRRPRQPRARRSSVACRSAWARWTSPSPSWCKRGWSTSRWLPSAPSIPPSCATSPRDPPSRPCTRLVIAGSAALGLLVGAVCNVLIDRVPDKVSLPARATVR